MSTSGDITEMSEGADFAPSPSPGSFRVNKFSSNKVVINFQVFFVKYQVIFNKLSNDCDTDKQPGILRKITAVMPACQIPAAYQ